MLKDNKNDAQYYIDKLNMTVHEEGGSFSELYRSSTIVQCPELTSNMPCLSVIYFLQKQNTRDLFHEFPMDEAASIHIGLAVEVFIIYPDDGTYEIKKLGFDIDSNENFTVVIKKNSIFSYKTPKNKESEYNFSLFSCSVAPAFDYTLYKLYSDEEILERFPSLNSALLDFFALEEQK